jgi:hypothetical protein
MGGSLPATPFPTAGGGGSAPDPILENGKKKIPEILMRSHPASSMRDCSKLRGILAQFD